MTSRRTTNNDPQLGAQTFPTKALSARDKHTRNNTPHHMRCLEGPADYASVTHMLQTQWCGNQRCIKWHL